MMKLNTLLSIIKRLCVFSFETADMVSLIVQLIAYDCFKVKYMVFLSLFFLRLNKTTIQYFVFCLYLYFLCQIESPVKNKKNLELKHEHSWTFQGCPHSYNQLWNKLIVGSRTKQSTPKVWDGNKINLVYWWMAFDTCPRNLAKIITMRNLQLHI